ncbi:PAS domain S-box protein [Variovorax saccharolyticus]|uniref:PAS domain S-box protein n=1 Tax=Variovorax saccharolyticus TaxID=3053516 RepID=UPI0025762AAB|nr:PAS domain S-box protein [Variovorax sp. J31P216]MDM0029449.1 PAS domain S-box protein [Variovorax sp. J31P216]
MAVPERRPGPTASLAWTDAADAMYRAAQAVAGASGPGTMADLVQELARILGVATAFVGVFKDSSRNSLHTLAAVLDGQAVASFDYPLDASPWAEAVGRACRFVIRGIPAAEFAPGTVFADKGIDSGAAFPLHGADGRPLGLLVAMDRQPIADTTLAEALLKIFASRIIAEIERSSADEALRAAALAVSAASGESVFAELTRYLAMILNVEMAFISRHQAEDGDALHMLAIFSDGEMRRGLRYPVKGTPCEHVLGQRFRAYPSKLRELFELNEDVRLLGAESYAGLPLNDAQGRPLGTIGIVSRQPLANVERIESMLRIFAGRAAAEIEQLGAREALQRSEASYRAIFEASEDSIFIHDWDSGAILDANPKACEVYGYDRDQLCRLSLADIRSGEAPYSAEQGLAHMQLAKLGRCPPFEWHRRSRSGELRWDEVRLKPAMIGGRHHIVAFTRDITDRKAAVEALRSREEQYRVIFAGSADALALWNDELCIVDVNPAFVRMFGYARDQIIGKSLPPNIGVHERALRVERIRAALAGEEGVIETRGVRQDGSAFDIELRYLPIGYAGAPHVLVVGRDITERRAALAALQAQEQKYRAIFDGSVDSMVLWSQELRTIDVNQAFVRMTGMAREQVVGRHWTERPDAKDMERLIGFIEAALQGRETQAVEPVSRADGSAFHIELRYIPVRLGERPYVLGVGRDVSERLASERALRASEAQYRGIFNASADALVLRAANFSIVDANATYERMSGYSLAEVLGVDRVLANPPEIMATIRSLHERALAGEAVRLETELVRRDGERYDLELRGVPIVHHGEPHVLYIGRDMTQSKRAERALRNSEEQYRAIFNASADALVVRDADYRAVDVNPAYLEMSGFTRDEVLSAARVLTQPDMLLQQRHWDQHADILAGRPVRFEAPGMRKDGSPFHLEVSAMPVTYRGEPHVLYAARDITERRAAESERQALEAQLRQAQKMEAIGQLTGGIAHDFNNILTSVIGYLVLGQERAELLGDARLTRQLSQAHIAAQRARELIAQMLAFARRQRGRRRTLALGPLVGQTLQLLRATLPSSVSLDFVAPPSAGGDELHVAVDAVHLEQVLFNLCINARDAIAGSGWIRVRLGRHGGGSVCASCRARVEAGRWVELSVADSGSGIAPDLIDRIFEPFTSSKEVGRGSGMGLAMVHGIVHDHGGHVLVQTSPGAGSVFRVLLPPASGEAADAPGVPAASADAEALCARVLVVDDEAMVGDFMVELLSGWGIEVVLHRSPLEALAWLRDRSQALDLLITDQTMPQLDGLQLAQRAAALRPGLPVLLYTGNADGVDEAEAKRHGVCGVLHKPVDNESLHAMMKSCLQRARASALPGR